MVFHLSSGEHQQSPSLCESLKYKVEKMFCEKLVLLVALCILILLGGCSLEQSSSTEVKDPAKRAFMDCRLLRLTKEKVESELGQDSLAVVSIDEKGQIILPMDKGYYLFLLRTSEDNNIQTYTGMY